MSKQCLMNAEISLNLQSILQSSIWFNPLSRFQSSSVSKAAARAIYRIGAEPNADKRRERKRAMQEMSAAHSASRRLITPLLPTPHSTNTVQAWIENSSHRLRECSGVRLRKWSSRDIGSWWSLQLSSLYLDILLYICLTLNFDSH